MTSACIEWTGGKSEGYGVKYVDGKHVGVHRWVWEQAHGPIPEGLLVMHTCDNPPCYNLEHLKLGTHADNQADKMSKGRAPVHMQPWSHCKKGHELTPDNIYRSGTRKQCRKCKLEYIHKKRGKYVNTHEHSAA